MLTDLLKRPIQVGDTVLTNYHLTAAFGEISTVRKVTSKAVYVEVENREWGNTPTGWRPLGGTKLIRRRPDQVLVINEQLAYNKQNYPEAYL